MIFNKFKSFHGFSTVDLILLLSVTFTTVSLILPIVLNAIDSSKVEKARKEIRSIASESAFLPFLEEKGDRKPANTHPSNVAPHKKHQLDPWGNEYRKDLVKDDKGQTAAVVVWSKGPNGVAETVNFESSQDSTRIHFGGDDVGHVVPLAN